MSKVVQHPKYTHAPGGCVSSFRYRNAAAMMNRLSAIIMHMYVKTQPFQCVFRFFKNKPSLATRTQNKQRRRFSTIGRSLSFSRIFSITQCAGGRMITDEWNYPFHAKCLFSRTCCNFDGSCWIDLVEIFPRMPPTSTDLR